MEIKTKSVEKIKIQDKEYYSVNDFAFLTNRSPASIYHLVRNGNSIRKLKALNLLGKTFILCTELVTYPFVQGGKRTKVYYYNEKGEKVYDE